VTNHKMFHTIKSIASCNKAQQSAEHINTLISQSNGDIPVKAITVPVAEDQTQLGNLATPLR